MFGTLAGAAGRLLVRLLRGLVADETRTALDSLDTARPAGEMADLRSRLDPSAA